MPIVTPPTITGAPSPAPQRSDRNTFSDRVDLFVTWLIAAVAQFGAVASNVFDNATSAFNSAAAAASSSDSAASNLSLAQTAATQAQASATAVDAQSTNATSSTSISIAAGSKSISTQVGKSFFPGMNIKIASNANVSNCMTGVVVSYSSGTLVVDVFGAFGTGSFSDWSITRYVEEARSPASNVTLYQNFL